MWPFKKKPRREIHPAFKDKPKPNIPPELLTLMTKDVRNWSCMQDKSKNNASHFVITHTTGLRVATVGYYCLEEDLWKKEPDIAELAWQLFDDLVALKARAHIEKHLAGGGPCLKIFQ